MRKRQLVTILVLVVVLGGAARMARAGDWTELGADCEQSRNSSEVSGPIFSPSWTYALHSDQIIATPVTSGGMIIVAGSGGAVAALDAADGTVVWNRTFAGGVRATPMVSREQVAVATLGGTLTSLGLADGAIIWERAFGGQNYASPQLVARTSPTDADTIVVGAGFPAQDLWRFDALTGTPVWQTAPGAIVDLVDSTAAVAGSRVVVGMNGGRFQSLDLATGAAGWKLDTSGGVYLSSPLVVGDHVYMFPGDANAQLYAADSSTGAPLAGFPVAIPDLMPVAGGQLLGRGPATSSPMTVGGLVIVQLRRNDMLPSGNSFKVVMRESVAAIDPVTAQVRWQYAVSNLTAPNANGVPELGACPTPAGFAGPDGPYVVVSSSIEGRVAVLDALTGQERWTSALSSPGRSSPVFSNGQLLIATDDSVLHVFSSMTNHAPTAPTTMGPSDDQAFSATGTELTWHGASDPEAGPLSYVVRLEHEGHPETREESQAPAGQERMNVALDASTAYLFAVRSRDAQGALSAWSSTQRIQVGEGTSTTVTASPEGAVVPATMASPPVAAPSAPMATQPAPDMAPVAGDTATVESATSPETDAAQPAGCSIAGSRGSSAAPVLALGLLALIVRRRRAAARKV
jgi:outer membrane protein assembly factor BamB